MSENQETSSSDAAVASAATDAPLINLLIVSPSATVGTLNFQELPTTTTVGQLKDRIRESLPSRPKNEQQRLIHRGRLLAREGDTLESVFGIETLRSEQQHTLHLAVRETPDSQPQTNAPPHNQAHVHHHHHHPHHIHHRHPAHNPAAVRNPSPAPGIPPRPPNDVQFPAQGRNPFAPIAPHPFPNAAAQLIQQQYQTSLQWTNQLQRENHARQLQMRQQYQRQMEALRQTQQASQAAQATRGNTEAPQGEAGNAAGGRNSQAILQVPGQPAQTLTQSMGPNGEVTYTWTTIVTPNNGPVNPLQQHGAGPTSNPLGHGGLSAPPVQDIFRGADVTQSLTNAMQRSASLPNVANFTGPIRPIQPGVTTPLFPSSRNVSRTGTPEPSGAHANPGVGIQTGRLGTPQQAPTSHPQPEVYILSSPTGPRGLLIHNASDMYITPGQWQTPYPAAQPFMGMPMRQNLTQTMAQAARILPHPTPFLGHTDLLNQQPAIPQVPTAVDAAQPQAAQPAQPVQPVQPAQQQNQPARRARARRNRANNAANGGNPLEEVGRQLWLVIRLAIFVWWFTSSDASWTRWFTIVAIAIGVFIFNTGLLGGLLQLFAWEMWDAIRRYLEGLLPLDNPNQRAQENPPAAGMPAVAGAEAAAPAAADAVAPGPPAEPNPAQIAARLVAERRNRNGNWLLDQVRRLERAGVLFLASIAPGVAEQHIANLETREREEREERERREREAAAAAVAAAEAAQEALNAALTEAIADVPNLADSEHGASEGQHTDTSGGGQDTPMEDGSDVARNEQPPMVQA